MKFFKWLIPLIICISSFMIHINKVSASSYDWTNIYNTTSNSCLGANCTQPSVSVNVSSFNITTTNANFRASIGFSSGVIRNNASALVFPFSVVNSSSGGNITCSGVTSNTMYLPQSGITTYNDGTTSTTSYIYGSGGTAGIYDTYYCNDFNFNSDTFGIVAESVVINPNNSDLNITLPCMIYGNGSDLYAYCPIDSARQNTNYRVDSINLYFTQNSTNNEVYRIKYYSNRLLFEIDSSKQIISSINSNTTTIGSKLDEIKSKLDTNNNTQQQIQNNTNEIKNNLKDSSIDNNNASSSASTWSNKNATNGTITNLLTLPISLLQNILNGIQTTCNSFILGTLFDTDLILPCINLSDLIGSTLFNVIDLLFSGFMILNIAKKLIKIFNDFTNLKSNQIDEIYSNGGGSN